MKFIKKIKFNNHKDIASALKTCKVLHAVPAASINLSDFYLDAINYLGKPFYSEEDFKTKNKTGNLWSDIKYDPEKGESFSHSNTRQPFHTDGAYEANNPDISFFYCMEQSTFGGATTFLNPKVLLKCLSFYNSDLLVEIKNTIVHHFKASDQKQALILNGEDWNWNYFRAEKIKLVEQFHFFLEEVIYKSGLYENITLKKGESLFFWDKKVLHGRNAFLGNRHLRKAGIHV
jgi:alpha-ketoglutarate-dependent taurine dioxygenase